MTFRSCNIENLENNWIKTIHQDWPILTVQDHGKVNGMTVNWVQVGWLWNKPVVTVYVRPQRHTYPLINELETFSLAFFDAKEKDKLAYLGKASGKDEDKLAHCGYTVSYQEETPVIDQAQMVFVCKKLHVSDLNKDQFTDTSIPDACYAKGDFHRVFVAEIVDTLIKK